MKKEVLRFDGVTYIKDEIQFLNNFNMHIFQGEIMGLVCRNDFGIEALIELLNCNLPLHYGRVYFNEVQVNTYEHSFKTMNKIAIIEKQSRLMKDLTVADNVFVIRKDFKQYFISSQVLNKQFEKVVLETGVHINGAKLASGLTSYERCVVELLKAMVTGAKLIIIRDISHILSAADTENFFHLMGRYTDKGISFLYICSNYAEAVRICGRISIMQEGRIRKVLDKIEFKGGEKYFTNKTAENIIRNTEITQDTDAKLTSRDILKFQNVTTKYLKDLSFTIKMGECVTLLNTNNTIFDDTCLLMNREAYTQDGKILVDNKIFKPSYIHNAIDAGVAVIKNPISNMVFYNMSVIENLCFLMNEKRKFYYISKNLQKSVKDEYRKYFGNDIEEEDVRRLGTAALYDMVYYRIHLTKPKIVFCVQPFAVEDLMLRVHIAELINQLRKRGITVIILEENVSDSFMTADRVIIIEDGHLAYEYCNKDKR